MRREDKEYQTLATVNLEQAISTGTSETLQDSASTSKHETSSEADVDAATSEL